MTTDLRNLPAYVGDDATFRTWGSGIAAQIATTGLVQTSDTGQINWTTVLRPAITTIAGYEMWRFNDTLQATKPVFIKVEYGQGNSNTPRLQITVCTATNGAGTPAGQVGDVKTLSINVKPAGTLLPSYCSGSSNRLNLATSHGLATDTFATQVFVERTKSADGTATGDGIVTFLRSPMGAAVYFQVIPFSGSVPARVQNNNALDLTAGGLIASGSDIALAPTVVFYGRSLYASWCAYRRSDITELVSLTMSHLGASRTFMPLGAPLDFGLNLRNTTGQSLAMLWE